MNSLYQEIQGQPLQQSSQLSENEEKIKQMAEEFRKSPNQMAYLQNMIMKNPAMQKVQGINDLLHGKLNARELFIRQAKAKGINPDYAMSLLGLK